MEVKRSDVFGRKVFFLNPSLIMQNVLVKRLREMEYEVYTISDYRDAKPILSEYEDSVCFINTDDQLLPMEWYNFIKSFKDDLTLSSILLGVISTHMKPADKDKFNKDIELDGGFLSTTNGIDNTLLHIQNFLIKCNAMGRRRYVRLDCTDKQDCSGVCVINNCMIDLKLADISTAGFAATTPLSAVDRFAKGQRIGNVTINLERRTIQSAVDVFATKKNEKDGLIVLLFTDSLGEKPKEYIREYIFKKLQNEISSFVNESMKDTKNYSTEN